MSSDATLVTLSMLLLALVSAAAWLAGPGLLARWRRARVRRQPFPPPWRRVLRERMPAFARLPADPEDGRNVVIHEFAHRLDQVHGEANGAPWLPGAARRQLWAAVFGAEFAALKRRVAAGEHGLIDDYGAHNAAEFFAVTSELFFERPEALAAAHPALHQQLRSFYGVDPRHWRAVTAGLGPRPAA